MNMRDGRRNPIVMLSMASVFALALAVAAPPALAQVVKGGKSDLDKRVKTSRQLRISQTLTDSDALKGRLTNADEISRFRTQYGASWRFLIDQRTGRLNLLSGGGIPLIPGAANKLSWDRLGGDCKEPSCIRPAQMESLTRDFLKMNQGALQVSPEELVLDPVGTAPSGNSIYNVRYQWVHGGVPVEGASVFLSINNGNLVQVGVQSMGAITVDPKPALTVERAWAALRAYLGSQGDKDEVVNNGTLVILPVTPKGIDPDNVEKVPFGAMIDYVLVYRLSFRRAGVLGTWEALVNAQTGEVLKFVDANIYGHVQGGVYKTDAPQTEVTVPFPKDDYGVGVFADNQGDFPGVAGTSTMSGLATGSTGVSGGVRIADNCGTISQGSNGAGIIDFGNQGGAGTDCTTPGNGGAGNTHAARTQYWNVTEIKMKGITYLPTNTWLQGQVTDTVNIASACNAFWNGSTLNFFRTGTLPAGTGNYFGPFSQSCGNTGELPGVSLHEWGHGMDSNDGSGGVNQPVETRADWTAILQTHQSCTGGGFFTARSPVPTYGLNCGGYGNPCTSCTGIREADFALHSTPTPWTPQNFNTVWGPGYDNGSGPVCNFGGGSPCGWEVHCESGIATQALWDFVNRDLVAAPTSLDLVSAWQLADRLFYTGMPQSTNMYTCTGTTTKVSSGCGAGSLYTVMRAIDDDNGNLGDGTPHAAAIYAALNRHHIACGNATDANNQNHTACPALTTPTATAVASSNQVVLNWTSGGGSATRYFVYRNETGCNAGFTKIGTVATLTSTDTSVVHGLTYYYRVQAATANDACVSAMSACVTAVVQLPPDRDFYVRDWTDTTASRDNGQEPSTNYSYNWAYSSDVWNRPNNTPGTPNANDWYPTDNMYAGAATAGDNYGFVRVHRNASGSTATVTADILTSPFGVGSAFSTVATTDLNFAAGDVDVVQGAYFHQDDNTSTHACIAVQIHTSSSPSDDPFLPPAIAGHSPGDPDGQFIMLADNNKAQRNLGVSHNVAHFAGLSFALIHNPGLVTRDIILGYNSPGADRLQGASIEIIGGKTIEFRPGGTLTLAAMEPGENRWIAVRRMVPDGDPIPIHFSEIENGQPAPNGFTVVAEPSSVDVVIADNLRDHVQVFNRLVAAFGAKEASAEAEAAGKLLGQKQVAGPAYLDFLKQRASAIGPILERLVAKGGAGDQFGAQKTLTRLDDAAGKQQVEQAAAEHAALLAALDSFATMLQKADGDPADILQMVRWQEALYRKRGDIQCSVRVVKESGEFIAAYDQKKPDAYPALLRSLVDCFHLTGKAMTKEAEQAKVEAAAAGIEATGFTLPAVEKAHREFLLTVLDPGRSLTKVPPPVTPPPGCPCALGKAGTAGTDPTGKTTGIALSVLLASVLAWRRRARTAARLRS